MTPFVQALDSALLHFVWQGAVVASLLWVALAALRRRSANARYLASCLALGVLTATPIVTACMAYTSPSHSDTTPITFAIVAVTAAIRPMPSQVDWVAVARAWMLPIWACGVLMLSIRLLWGCAKVSNLRRKGDAADPDVLATIERLAKRIGVTKPVGVIISSIADGPSVVGWLRPVLLLPAATVFGLTPEQLEAVLSHELAHIRRYDYLVNLGQMLIETLFFYHPAVWWISSRIRKERELCCDDVAVRTCGDAVCYARALAALERMRVMTPSFSFSAALGAKDGPLRYRIERLLGMTPREQAPSRLPGIAAILLGLACLAPNMNPAKAQAPQPQVLLAAAQEQAPEVPLIRTPVAVGPSRTKTAPRILAQVTRTNPAFQATRTTPNYRVGPVTVEVNVNRNGDVDDARVISGPLEQRRAALMTALGMHFPQDDGPGIRQVQVLGNTRSLLFDVPLNNGVTRALTWDQAMDRVTTANNDLAKLRTQQAQASERGAAQLQEAIDGRIHTVEEMRKILSGQSPVVGKRIEIMRIDGVNMTDDARAQLLAQLPIHMHELVTEGAMIGSIQVVKKIYPDADVFFGTVGADAAGFVVMVPGPRPAPPVR